MSAIRRIRRQMTAGTRRPRHCNEPMAWKPAYPEVGWICLTCGKTRPFTAESHPPEESPA